jgi:hypothetical protein
MKTEIGDEIVYALVVEDLQGEALERIGRELTEDEIYTTKKCIEWGLSSCIDTIMETAIDLAIAEKSNQ